MPRFARISFLALLAACAPRGAVQGLPQPTEDVLDEDAEERQKERRKAWFEHRHQAEPGVDWRALERANGAAQIEKRNRLATPALAGAEALRYGNTIRFGTYGRGIWDYDNVPRLGSKQGQQLPSAPPAPALAPDAHAPRRGDQPQDGRPW